MDTIDAPTKEEWLRQLLKLEVEAKETRRIDRLISQAKFTNSKALDTYQWHPHIRLPDSDTKEQMVSLQFIHERQNIVCIGAPGTGKRHMATGLGRKTCQAGIETRFWRVSDLVLDLEKAWQDIQLERFKKRFSCVKLIILDEMGYVPFTKNGSELLFQLISDWYEQKILSLPPTLNLVAGIKSSLTHD